MITVLFGAALLIQAFAVLTLMAGVLFLPDPKVDLIRSVGIAAAVFEALLAIALAASFTVIGANAFLSGLAGTASGIKDAVFLFWPMALVGLVVPLVLAALWWIRLPAANTACAFLIGTGIVGYLATAYLFSPQIGLKACDAQWTDTVMAMSTAAAAVVLGFGTRDFVKRSVRRNKPELEGTRYRRFVSALNS